VKLLEAICCAALSGALLTSFVTGVHPAQASQNSDYRPGFRQSQMFFDPDPMALFNRGVMYDKGQGVTQDRAEAVRWYRLAADQGLSAAQYNLGQMYSRGEGVPQDRAEAFRWRKWFQLAAAQGDPEAQNNLAAIYGLGQGVPRDNREAMYWYRRAADQGDSVAQYNLANMYAQGQGVAKDPIQAHYWFSLAAAQGDEDAVAMLNRLEGKMTRAQLNASQKLVRESRTFQISSSPGERPGN
jgi:TPR repeat protein